MMQIKPFELERWFALYEFEVENNMCASCAEETSTGQLLELAGSSKVEEYLNLPLNYIPNPGNARLRELISENYPGLKPEQIQVTTGASEAILLLMINLLEPGENLVVQYPIYQSLFSLAESMKIEVKRWNLQDKNNFYWDVSDLKNLIDSKTKLIVINNPHSPTGSIMTLDQLQEIIRLAEKNGSFLLSDEVYYGLVYNQNDLLPPAVTLSEQAISLGDMSKPYGLGGLRIGWLASHHKNLLAACSGLRDYTTMCSSAPSEFLAVIALENKNKILNRKISLARENLSLLEQFIQENGDILSWTKPKGGVSAFPRYNLDLDSVQFCEGLIKRENTLLLPGSVFGLEYHFRIGFGKGKKDFRAGLNKIGRYLDFLRKK
ncbi:MAG TPA: aminotransferase class I/II-fold pyridoxal phosphate-dependent enzyme [Clostridia bacterium]|nr:aminotransferase class I/II-fold pyridoxal phosphate-dependent enzyme [Clostridia bacterium]